MYIYILPYIHVDMVLVKEASFSPITPENAGKTTFAKYPRIYAPTNPRVADYRVNKDKKCEGEKQ